MLFFSEAPNEFPVYNWFPEHLARANASSEYLAALLQQHLARHPDQALEELKAWIDAHLVAARLGITDALDVELNTLASNPAAAAYAFAAMVSLRARVGWSTHGHSAVDVNIYSSGGSPAVDRLRGNVENTEIGDVLAEYLGVDTDEVTRLLREANKAQTAVPDEAELKEEVARRGEWDPRAVPQAWVRVLQPFSPSDLDRLDLDKE
jgi:alkaline phosphatase